MSFFVILALLFCFNVQGSYPVFEDIFYVDGNDYEDLDQMDTWDWNSWFLNGSYPEIEEDDQLFEYEDLMEDTLNGPLSPVNLTVDSVSNSSDSCNLTVTCSTFYFDINSTFICDTKTCYQKGGEQRESWEWFSVSLHVYLSDVSIICNHSNGVNWTKDMTETGHFCPLNAGSKSLSDGISICMIKTVVFSVGLVIMLSAVISVHVIEKLKKQN